MTIENEIREQTLQLEMAWNRGDSAAAAKVFGTDAMLVGEGVPMGIAGAEGIGAVMQQLVAGNHKVAIEIKELRNTGDTSAMCWVLWRVTPTDPEAAGFNVRSLFVWTRGADGVRIRADSYSMGNF